MCTFVTTYDPTAFWPSGSLYLDWCLGGGLPQGRYVNLWGNEGTGKTTLALLMCKAAVDRGGYAAYVDAENALDPLWAMRFGLDHESAEPRFFLIQPESAEDALNAILKMLKMKHPDDQNRSAFDVIILDSIASLATKAELAGEMGDRTVASLSQILAQFFKASKSTLRDSTTCLVGLNQARDKFGQTFGYGPAEQQPGGRSVRFYASIIAKMQAQGDQVLNEGEVIGRTFRLKTTKNKVSRLAEAAVKVYFDTGTVDVFEELATIGKELGVFTKEDGKPIKGASNWFFLRDSGRERVGKGLGNVADKLDADRALAAEVEAAVRVTMAAMNRVRPACGGEGVQSLCEGVPQPAGQEGSDD